MKLIEALKILREALPPDAEPLTVFLACGFMPGHLETFLAAHLRRLCPSKAVTMETGLYGDLAGSLGRLTTSSAQAAAIVIEWPDLDPRLGLRSLGGWRPEQLPDILATAQARLRQYLDGLAAAAGRMPVALLLPSLPLPPFAHTSGSQMSPVAAGVQQAVATAAAEAAQMDNVRLANPQRLDARSPLGGRLDAKSELMSGFPYAPAHADAVAELLVSLLQPPAPKKGLITDLDDTLWRGILGEVGVDGVSWDLDHHSQMHGLYQQLLHSLAEAGVLIAVASRNDLALTQDAFARPDRVLPADRVFPMEVHWGRKSESVARILDAWNIAADSVVFVDDSPMELAEVGAAYPDITCLPFPTRDDQAAYALLEQLRDLFGKERVSDEDGIRLGSLRSASHLREHTTAGTDPDRFLADAQATLALDFSKAPDPRAFELINKTNQFNLNGRRLGEAEWQARLAAPDTFLLVAAYEDKFGPLGKIAAILGRAEASGPVVDTWVMSCRAFGRRIEHRCLEHLFAKLDAETIHLDFAPTERNRPLQEFLASFLGAVPEGGFALSHAQFAAKCPPLFHDVKEPSVA